MIMRRHHLIADVESIASELRSAQDRLARSVQSKTEDATRVRRERALVVLDLERRLSKLIGAGALDPRGCRPAIRIYGEAGQVEASAYGQPTRGVTLHRIKTLTPRQVAIGTAYASLVEIATSSGGGGPQMGERVDGAGGGDGTGARSRAIEASNLVRRAEAAALSLGDLVAKYGSKAAPASIREWIIEFIYDETSGGRLPISRVTLMRAVCLHNRSLSDCLSEAGWAANDRAIKVVASALGDALSAVDAEWGDVHRHITGGSYLSVRSVEG